MANPFQKKKEISSKKTLNKPIVLLKYSVSNVDSFIYCLHYITTINKDNNVTLI